MVTTLKKALSYDDTVVHNSKRLKAILLDIIPNQKANINLFSATVTAEVAKEIAAYQNKKVPKHQKERWVKRLINEWAIDRQKALWAVECWCEVFEIDYTKNTNENQLIFEDKKTGLIWQDDEAVANNKMTWQEAMEYAKKLNKEKFAGYDDWRVPTIEELQTIVDYSRYDPAIKKEFKNVASYYWSSTTNVDNTSLAWLINFHNGFSNCTPKLNSNYVRCMRSGENIEPEPCHFQRDAQKEIVMDISRNLIWQDDEAVVDNEMTWQEAMEYAKKLNKERFAGYDDWRVPTIEELLTIVDYSRYDPAIRKEFKNVALYYWSFTTSVYNTSRAWGVGFYFGSGYWGGKSNTNYVRCVRSGQ